ncbi:MAG: ADOP family duplicated permease [Acidobacteriota bacterium]|jgi:predicted permease
MSSLWRPIAVGIRTHRRRPLLSLIIVLSLVLGIGVNTAVISLVDTIFLRPLPIDDLDRLVTVYRSQRLESGVYTGKGRVSYSTYQDLRARNRTLEAAGIFTWTPVNLAGAGAEPIRATAMFADDGYWKVLGLRPAHGRFFRPDEVDVHAPADVVILSHGTWVRRFGADPGIVGRVLRVNGRPLTVIGVGPAGFNGTKLHVEVDVWVPAPMYRTMGPSGHRLEERDVSIFTMLGRLAPGATPEEAERELMSLSQQLETEHPIMEEGSGADVDPLLEGVLVPRERPSYIGYVQILGLAGVLVLLVSCLNAAVLLLLRGLERRHELAVRQVLGAERTRLVGQLVGENLLLFGAGGLLSLPVASWTLDLLWKFRPPRFSEGGLDTGIDPSRLLWAAGLAALAALVFGIVPAWRSARLNLVGQIHGSASHSPTRIGSFRAGDLLVIGQVAFATVALVGGGLFLNHLREAREIELGFEPEQLAVVTLAPGDQGYDDERVRRLYDEIEERVRALPGVENAALAANRLLRGAILQRQLFLPGDDQPLEGGGRLYHRVNAVRPGYFDTVGISLQRGRDFDSSDRADSHLVAVINQTMADALWPGESPLGRRIHFDYVDTPPVEVIGVAENARYRYIHEDPQFFLYVPFSQSLPSDATLHVRTAVAPEDILPAVRDAIHEVDSSLPLEDVAPMSFFVSEALWIERTAAFFLAGMSLLALLLVIIGIHGVMAFSVRRRARDFGVHLSLGAERVEVLAQVFRQAGRRVLIGLLVGSVTALVVLGWVASSFLGELDPAMTALFVVVAAVLIGLSALAGALRPALMAARWEPVMLLRDE